MVNPAPPPGLLAYPGRCYLGWDIVRDLRDQIQARVTDLLRDLNI